MSYDGSSNKFEETMGLLDKAFGRLGYTKSADAWDTFLSMAQGIGTGKGYRVRNQRQQIAAYRDWVYAAASQVAQEASTIDFHAYANRSPKSSQKVARQLVAHPHKARTFTRSTDSSKGPVLEELDNHILLDFLDHPNPMIDGQRMMEITYLHMLLAGESFWGIIRNGVKKPGESWPIMPYEMKEVVSEDGHLIGWTQRHNGQVIPWDIADVVHYPITNPENLFRGMGVVQAAARAVETDTNAADWNRNFFANSARPDLALETEQTLSTQTFERMKGQWNDEYQGTDKAHRVAILEGGLKLNKLALTQKEMDFLESRKFDRDQILAMFATSKSILGLIEDSNRANMEAADYNHAKRVIRPLMARVTSIINFKLAPEYDPKLVIGFADPVPEDKEFKLKEQTEGINKFWTINEVRESRGLDPVEGGDVLYQAGTLVPITAESAVYHEPAPGAPAEPNDNRDSEDPAVDPKADEPAEGKKGLGKLSRFMLTPRNEKN